MLTFLHRLHHSLQLGEVGTFVFGVVALPWFVDCFVGAYLTFPPRRTPKGRDPAKEIQRSRLARWARAWALRTGKLWLIALHFGAIRELGRAYRAIVSVLGVIVTLLSVTGVWIWWRKRKRATPRRDAARSVRSAEATSPLP